MCLYPPTHDLPSVCLIAFNWILINRVSIQGKEIDLELLNANFFFNYFLDQNPHVSTLKSRHWVWSLNSEETDVVSYTANDFLPSSGTKKSFRCSREMIYLTSLCFSDFQNQSNNNTSNWWKWVQSGRT